MDKFTLMYSPTDIGRDVYILHRGKPRCLIGIEEITDRNLLIVDDAGEIDEIFQIFEHGKVANKRYFRLVIRQYFDINGIGDVLGDLDSLKKYYKLLEKAWGFLKPFIDSGKIPKPGIVTDDIVVDKFNAKIAAIIVDSGYIEELNLILLELRAKAKELGNAHKHTGQNVYEFFKPLRDKTKKELIKRGFRLVEANGLQFNKNGLMYSIYWK